MMDRLAALRAQFSRGGGGGGYLGIPTADDEGTENGSPSIGSRIREIMQRYVGERGLKYLVFVALLLGFVLYALAIQSHEQALADEHNISVFHRYHRSPLVKTTPSPTPFPTFMPTTVNSTSIIVPNQPSKTQTVKEEDSTYTFFMSLMLSLLGWLLVIQVLNCVRRSSMAYSATQRRRQQMEMVSQIAALSRGNAPGLAARLRVAMLQRDFTGDDYELLRQLDSMNTTTHRGASENTIGRLPTHRVTAAELEGGTPAPAGDVEQGTTPPATTTENNPLHCCNICLAPYEVGEEVRTLQCLHRFHKPCIDHWLRTNAVCPICKHAVTDEGN